MYLNRFTNKIIKDKLKELPYFIDFKYKKFLATSIERYIAIYKVKINDNICFLNITYDANKLSINRIIESVEIHMKHTMRYFEENLTEGFIMSQFNSKIKFDLDFNCDNDNFSIFSSLVDIDLEYKSVNYSSFMEHLSKAYEAHKNYSF